jgi:hypothetical protein
MDVQEHYCCKGKPTLNLGGPYEPEDLTYIEKYPCGCDMLPRTGRCSTADWMVPELHRLLAKCGPLSPEYQEMLTKYHEHFWEDEE